MNHAALAAGRIFGRDSRRWGEDISLKFCRSCANLVGVVRYRERMVR